MLFLGTHISFTEGKSHQPAPHTATIRHRTVHMSLPKLSLHEAYLWTAHQEQGLAHPALLILCMPRSRVTACPSSALRPPWLKGLPNHLSFSTPSTVKKENMIPSLYFGHCFSTSVSFPGQLPHSHQHPPLQHQTLAASSPQGSSAKPTNCLFVQGHLGIKRAVSTAQKSIQMQTSTQSKLFYPMHQTCSTAHYRK